MTINENDMKKIHELGTMYMDIFIKLMNKGNDPCMVAALLVQQGLSVYRTVLTPEDYALMVDEIHRSADTVPPMVTVEDLESPSGYMN